MGTLDALGMNEREALEYVLMLSRDEEEKRLLNTDLPTVAAEDDPFQDDFDAVSMYSPKYSPPTRAGPPSLSNAKVQVSPRRNYGSLEAGLTGSPVGVGRSLSAHSSSSAKGVGQDGFPSMSSSASSTSSGSTSKASVVGSPSSFRSAWSAPLKNTPPSPTSTSVRRQRTRSPEEKLETSEDRDLRYAIELSLAEARSRGQDV